MRLKDILVHLDGAERSETRLRVAADLARRHEAHLTAVNVIDVVSPFVLAGDAGGAVLAELMEGMRRDALAEASRVEAAFRERLRLDGIAGGWRLVEGIARTQVALHARYADLVVVGQEESNAGDPPVSAVAEHALFASGRPVLVVPAAGRPETVGRRVLVGWNASREAARAVNDALPVIARAEATTVLAADPRHGSRGHGEEPGADIALHLARHGLKVGVDRIAAGDIDVADLLLNRAAELSADLLVVGAYGHSRLREVVLGGVTRTLLRQTTVPVLMSH
ncbi:MAG: universal stress protein [Acetobacteraceae bacterium]|nr:universal stress protein [Acetobacteraceae bacterium]